MIVTCERCTTQFQLDDARVPADGVRVRCSRCKHAFLVEPPVQTEAEEIHRVAERALDTDAVPDATEDLATSSILSNEAADVEEESDWQFNDGDPSAAASEPLAHPDASSAAENAVDGLLAGPAPAVDFPLPPVPIGSADDPILDEDDDAEDLDVAAVDSEPLADPAPGGLPFEADAFDEAAIDDVPDLEYDEADDLGGAAAGPAPLADEATESEEGDELGSPDEWDIFEEPIAADATTAPAASTVSTAERIAPPRPAALAEEMFDDEAPRGAWRRRAVETVGWLATGALCVAGLVSGLRPDSPERQTPAVTEIGGMTLEAVSGRWLDNAAHGPIYVVSGRVRNAGSQPRSSAPLLLELQDASGRPLQGASIPLGPAVAPRTLREADLASIRAAQRAQVAFQATLLQPNEVRSFQAVAGSLSSAAERFAFRVDERARRAPGPDVAGTAVADADPEPVSPTR